jgi:hypothetical protein
MQGNTALQPMLQEPPSATATLHVPRPPLFGALPSGGQGEAANAKETASRSDACDQALRLQVGAGCCHELLAWQSDSE